MFMLQSFDPLMLEALHALEPTYQYGLLIETSDMLRRAFNTLSFKPEFFNPEHILLTPEFITEVHNSNANCYTWTVNDLKHVETLKNIGVDGIITDFPELFQKNIGI